MTPEEANEKLEQRRKKNEDAYDLQRQRWELRKLASVEHGWGSEQEKAATALAQNTLSTEDHDHQDFLKWIYICDCLQSDPDQNERLLWHLKEAYAMLEKRDLQYMIDVLEQKMRDRLEYLAMPAAPSGSQTIKESDHG